MIKDNSCIIKELFLGYSRDHFVSCMYIGDKICKEKLGATNLGAPFFLLFFILFPRI